ncbi:hypothetical protein P8C59_000607 [Phyllachora maydis]|uniref:DUF1237 domain-containing protein n=1 Tax=Phyllachora maydis TaxID=1825666 RepID=A0AAD9HWI3_9PEZI|nr:hypothetical protein P8C59_000607 [Phyllachora maydis]
MAPLRAVRPLLSLLSLAICVLGYQAADVVGDGDDDQRPLGGVGFQPEEACPDYAAYSTYAHRPLSKGPLALPYQRPDPRCRTFHSDEIERVIDEVTARMKNPDLARLFENAFPSTTDTTVKFHTDGHNAEALSQPPAEDDDTGEQRQGEWQGPHSFIITGDIVAEWLRDSTNQLAPYQALAARDPALRALVVGAVATQAEYVIAAPYCNAFQPPPIAPGLRPTPNDGADTVHPAYNRATVFECKYELDSLAHFLALGNALHAHTTTTTGSAAARPEFLTARWRRAFDTVLRVLEQQSRATFDPDTGAYARNEYTFQRNTNTGTETLGLAGVGNPLAGGTGLVRSAFRPSDDATILGFLVPANAMMAVELRRAAEVLRTAGGIGDAARADAAADWSRQITDGIWAHGVVHHKRYGDVFAYEVDGYGSAILMDDANYPSLLALPRMGFVDRDDKTYQNTRRMLLEKAGNPYFLQGREFQGIGGPHVGLQNAWPMSLLIQAQTSDDDDEIMRCITYVLESSKLGLVHESVDVNLATSYTRSWFAWANGVFAETILDLAKRKPHLILNDSTPYEVYEMELFS